jgi:hypothetical protein
MLKKILPFFLIIFVFVAVLLGRMFFRDHRILDSVGSGDTTDDEIRSDDPMFSISESGNMIVTSPTPEETVGLPLVIVGRARVFEHTLNYRLLDSDGISVLAEGYTTANAPDIGLFGDFTITTSYAAPSGNTGMIEVFDYSAKDGSVIDLVQIPIAFLKQKN